MSSLVPLPRYKTHAEEEKAWTPPLFAKINKPVNSLALLRLLQGRSCSKDGILLKQGSLELALEAISADRPHLPGRIFDGCLLCQEEEKGDKEARLVLAQVVPLRFHPQGISRSGEPIAYPPHSSRAPGPLEKELDGEQISAPAAQSQNRLAIFHWGCGMIARCHPHKLLAGST